MVNLLLDFLVSKNANLSLIGSYEPSCPTQALTVTAALCAGEEEGDGLWTPTAGSLFSLACSAFLLVSGIVNFDLRPFTPSVPATRLGFEVETVVRLASTFGLTGGWFMEVGLTGGWFMEVGLTGVWFMEVGLTGVWSMEVGLTGGWSMEVGLTGVWSMEVGLTGVWFMEVGLTGGWFMEVGLTGVWFMEVGLTGGWFMEVGLTGVWFMEVGLTGGWFLGGEGVVSILLSLGPAVAGVAVVTTVELV